MAEYKQSKGPRGRALYFKKEEGGFKMISRDKIPVEILATMKSEKPVNDQLPEFRKCIFCGAQGTEEKRLNGEKFYLCLDDYNSRTTGEIAQKLREGIASPQVA